MKRLLAVLLFVVMGAPAWAVNEDCVSTASGLWSAAGTWTACGGGVPGAATGQSAQVAAAHVVLYDQSALTNPLVTDTNSALTVNGTLDLSLVAGTRDGDGFRTLTANSDGDATAEFTGGASGVLILGPGDRLAWDLTAGDATSSLTDGFRLIALGETWTTKIAAITSEAADAPTCGTTAGLKWTITPERHAGRAKAMRRVVFENGPAITAHLEFVSVSASSFVVCTDYADGSSGGQRLTPHANFNEYCTGAGAPIACCSGADAGTCRDVFPASVHSTPWLGGNASCVGSKDPFPGCTGAGTGTLIAQIPEVGDAITIVDDAWIYASAGPNDKGWSFVWPSTGSATPPVLYAVNFGNIGANALDGISYRPTADDAECRLEYGNLHDYQGSPIVFRGCQPTVYSMNTAHDAGGNANEAGGALQILHDTVADPDRPALGVTVVGNRVYRAMGNSYQILPGAETVSMGQFRAYNNWGFDGCITLTGECSGFEWGATEDGDVHDNVVFDIYPGDGAASTAGIDWGGPQQTVGWSLAVHHNWVVNVGQDCYKYNLDTGDTLQVGVTHNYASHCRNDGFDGPAAYYSNVSKNASLGTTQNGTGIRNATRAYGNFIGDDSGVTNSANGAFDWSGTLTIGPTLADNIISSRPGAAVKRLLGQFSAWNDAPAVVIDHTTVDGNEISVTMVDFDNFVPTVARTTTVRDTAYTHSNGGVGVDCSSDADVTGSVDRMYRSTAPGVALTNVSTGCVSNTNESTQTGGLRFRNRSLWNYQPADDSPLIGAGGSPSGSFVGARGFRFDMRRWPHLPFDGLIPVTWDNADSRDTDGDGVIDLHDNCPRDFNPSQLDTNDNGVGDACGG